MSTSHNQNTFFSQTHDHIFCRSDFGGELCWTQIWWCYWIVFLWDTIAFENIHVVAIHDPCKLIRQLKQLILFSKHLITNFRGTGREPWWTQTWWCHHLPLVAGRGGRKCGDAAWMKWNYFVSEVFLKSLCRSWGSIIYMERPRFLQRHSWRTACAELGVESFSWSGPVVPRQIFGEHVRWQHCRNWRTVACTVSWWPVRVVRLTENAGERVKQSNCTVSGWNGRPDTTQLQKQKNLNNYFL